jgi:hypothetical protein
MFWGKTIKAQVGRIFFMVTGFLVLACDFMPYILHLATAK